MTVSFLPRVLANAVTEITPAQLKKWGVQLLMLDFDNTLVPYTTDIPTEKVLGWLEAVRDAGIGLCVVSNSKKDRVKIFCRKYGIDCITHAKKPGKKGIAECIQKYQMSPDRCALIGDQIYTDTLGANRSGVRSILVKAIHNHTFWLKARHMLEMPFILIARKRRIVP
ncbi:MAG: YqeG family HAD IIIA-type phosphatase [Ruminococcaceae bacterium]|nr:YqeG family HAD IIIA-type phosphatase [Oscillospiraceae bacterium]